MDLMEPFSLTGKLQAGKLLRWRLINDKFLFKNCKCIRVLPSILLRTKV